MRSIILFALLGGCAAPADPSATIAPNATACKKPGQRCRLTDNALGVCQLRATGAAPAYECTPQH